MRSLVRVMSWTQLLGGDISVLEVCRDEYIDSHYNTMCMILSEWLGAFNNNRVNYLPEILRDLFCDI